MNILIIDTETTGLDTKSNKLIEIAAVLYNTTSKSILHACSTLIPSDSNEAFHINNISVEALQQTSVTNTNFGINMIKQLMIEADLFVAHYAVFDRKWLESYEPIQYTMRAKKWLCTKKDIKWPSTENLKLQSIAKRMDVSYKNAHRALGDCFILLECLQKLDNLDDQLNKLFV